MAEAEATAWTYLMAGCIWALRGCCLFYAVEETLKILTAAPGARTKGCRRAAFWWTSFAFVMTWLF